MSSYTVKSCEQYLDLFDLFTEFAVLGLSNPNPVKIITWHDSYERTPEMLYKTITDELLKNYKSPEVALTNSAHLHKRRGLFL